MVNKPLIRPYFWGCTLGGGRWTSHSIQVGTPPKTNIEPEHSRFVDVFPFPKSIFQVPAVHFLRGKTPLGYPPRNTNIFPLILETIGVGWQQKDPLSGKKELIDYGTQTISLGRLASCQISSCLVSVNETAKQCHDNP